MKRFVVPILIAIGALLLVLLLRSPLASIEDQLTALKYRVRGEQQADSNIVIVYIDNDAINELGWKPKYPKLEDIVATAWAWHQCHPSGYAD